MSSSNAAAIRRRVTAQQAPTPPPTPTSVNNANTNNTNNPQNRFTVPQALGVLDKRIVKLEEFMNNINPTTLSQPKDTNAVTLSEVNGVFDEFNLRFEMLAAELSNMKDALLSLQTYTMEVNKMLVTERVRILSDLGTTPNMKEQFDTDLTSVFSLTSDVTTTLPTIMNEITQVSEELPSNDGESSNA